MAKLFSAVTVGLFLVACSGGGDRPKPAPYAGPAVLAAVEVKAPVSRAAVDFYVNTKGVMVGIFSEPGVTRFNGLFNGLYRSIDGGVSWAFLDASRIYRQAFVHPDGDVFALTDDKLWRYTVAGEWEDITPPSSLFFQVGPYSKLGMFPDGTLFAKGDVRYKGYMYYSTVKGSGGGAWDSVKDPTNEAAAGTLFYDFMVADTTQMLVKYEDDVYLTSTGRKFEKVYDFATHGFNVSHMSYGSDSNIYLMDGKAAWSSTDGGLSYQSIQPYVASGEEAIGFANIESYGGNLYYHSSSSVGWGSRYLPYISADGGESWSILGNVTHLLASRSYGGTLYFLSSRLGVLELAVDGRLLSFGPRPEFTRYKSHVTSIASDSAGRLLAVANNELVRSADDGATWEIVKSDSLNQHVLVSADNTIVVAGGQNYFAFSSDNGVSWAEHRPTRAGLSGVNNSIREIYEANGRLYVSVYEEYRDPVTDAFVCREPYLGMIDSYDADLMVWQSLSQPLGAFHQEGTTLQAIQACPGEYLQGRQSATLDYLQSDDDGLSWTGLAYGDYLGGFYSPRSPTVQAFFVLNTEILKISEKDYQLANVATEDGVYVSGFDAWGHYIYVNYTTGAIYRSEDRF